jgi:2-phospho-L-lactate guanylyltransferase
MKIWAAIPVKPLAEGKSRLSAALSLQARMRLNANLFRHTLNTVSAVFDPAYIIVVSRDPTLREIAASLGTQTIAEQGNELNTALNEAAALTPADAGLLAISTDLPNLTPEDISALLAEIETPITIAPDRQQQGTNALLTLPAARIPFQFGPDSFAKHNSAALAQGITPRIISRPGLAFDLDTEADLALCPKEFLGK